MTEDALNVTAQHAFDQVLPDPAEPVADQIRTLLRCGWDQAAAQSGWLVMSPQAAERLLALALHPCLAEVAK